LFLFSEFAFRTSIFIIVLLFNVDPKVSSSNLVVGDNVIASKLFLNVALESIVSLIDVSVLFFLRAV